MEDWTTIENLVNNCSFKPRECAKNLAKIHRYLQAQLFEMCYHYIIRLALAYKQDRFDARNETACRRAFELVIGCEDAEFWLSRLEQGDED